jgi:copper chaperone
MTVTTYRVEGMTCGHCVSSVTAEVSKIDGVSAVNVDLTAKLVTVTSGAPLDDAAVGAAVDEAGYELAGRAEAPAGEAEAGACCGSGRCS